MLTWVEFAKFDTQANVTLVSGARARRKVARVAGLSVGDARLKSLLTGR